MPYFIDGDFKFTESLAIHKYIADKWNPELLGKDEQTRGYVNMTGFIVNEFAGKQTMACYTSATEEAAR